MGSKIMKTQENRNNRKGSSLHPSALSSRLVVLSSHRRFLRSPEKDSSVLWPRESWHLIHRLRFENSVFFSRLTRLWFRSSRRLRPSIAACSGDAFTRASIAARLIPYKVTLLSLYKKSDRKSGHCSSGNANPSGQINGTEDDAKSCDTPRRNRFEMGNSQTSKLLLLVGRFDWRWVP